MTFLQGLGGVLTGGLSTIIDSIVEGANGGNGNPFDNDVGNSGSGVDGQGHWDWASGQHGVPTGSPADAMFGENGLFSNPTGAWDQFTNGQTNQINAQIARENLEYQRERNAIEDERYEEETAYNRAFAEEEQAYKRAFSENERDYQREFAQNERDYQRAFAEENRDYQRQFAEEEREYQRALQERLFNREDTALERQASSLSAMGINPLSQQLNGLGAGQALSASVPGSASAGSASAGSASAASASAPGASSRGGQALHNDMKYQGTGVLSALAPFMNFAQTMNAVETGTMQRDLLQSQVEHQNLVNFVYAQENGLVPYKYKDFNYLNGSNIGHGLFNRANDKHIMEQNMSALDYKYKYMPDFARNMNFVLSPDFMETAERAITKGSELYDKAFDSMDKDLFKDLGKDGKSWNPFQLLKSIFF